MFFLLTKFNEQKTLENLVIYSRGKTAKKPYSKKVILIYQWVIQEPKSYFQLPLFETIAFFQN